MITALSDSTAQPYASSEPITRKPTSKERVVLNSTCWLCLHIVLPQIPSWKKNVQDNTKRTNRQKWKLHAETLNGNHKYSATSNDDLPCDVQLFTTRLLGWKRRCANYCAELGIPIMWKNITSGDQLTITDRISISFFNTNFVMVQGTRSVDWRKEDFHVISRSWAW